MKRDSKFWVYFKNREDANLQLSSIASTNVRQSGWQVVWRIEENRYTRWVIRGIAASNLFDVNGSDYLPHITTISPVFSQRSSFSRERGSKQQKSADNGHGLKISRGLEELNSALKIFRPQIFISRAKIGPHVQLTFHFSLKLIFAWSSIFYYGIVRNRASPVDLGIYLEIDCHVFPNGANLSAENFPDFTALKFNCKFNSRL